jgi:hypothetical protein
MKKQNVFPVILTFVIMTMATTTLASIADVKAQSTIDDTEQVKEYLNQAMQALDDGNNTLALEQVDFASDALENMTGGLDAGVEGDDNDVTTEEGAGEDADEPGDADTNDEEDSESK